MRVLEALGYGPFFDGQLSREERAALRPGRAVADRGRRLLVRFDEGEQRHAQHDAVRRLDPLAARGGGAEHRAGHARAAVGAHRDGAALALAVREGALGRLTVEKADGGALLGSGHPLVDALAQAGFHATPRGLRLRR